MTAAHAQDDPGELDQRAVGVLGLAPTRDVGHSRGDDGQRLVTELASGRGERGRAVDQAVQVSRGVGVLEQIDAFRQVENEAIEFRQGFGIIGPGRIERALAI